MTFATEFGAVARASCCQMPRNRRGPQPQSLREAVLGFVRMEGCVGAEAVIGFDAVDDSQRLKAVEMLALNGH